MVSDEKEPSDLKATLEVLFHKDTENSINTDWFVKKSTELQEISKKMTQISSQAERVSHPAF